MAWFKKSKAPLAAQGDAKKVQMPEGLWTKCKNCEEIIYTKEIERNLNVCRSVTTISASAPASGSPWCSTRIRSWKPIRT
jgi:acetyl-CoA carboxylase beta subunit